MAQAFSEFAQSKNATTTQLALAWILAQGDDIIPIPGTRKIERLVENAGAVDLHLTAADLAKSMRLSRDTQTWAHAITLSNLLR